MVRTGILDSISRGTITMRKKSKKLIIKASDIKVSTGHRQHFTGTGAWDNRPKRQRTRSAQSRASIKEFC